MRLPDSFAGATRSARARVLAWFLPPSILRNAESLRQARLLLGICALTALVEPLFALRHFYVNKSIGAGWITLGLAAVAVVLPLLVRRGLPTAVAVQVTAGSIVVAGAGVCLARGAFLVTPLMAHIFLPLGGVLIHRRAVALRWAAIGAANLTLLASAARFGLFGLAPSSAAEYPQLLFFLVCSSVLAVAYDHTRRGLERDRARLQEDIAAGQRLESLGHLAAGVAHDFNNLLMVFRSAATVMLDELPAGHVLREDAESVEQAVERGVAITARLLSFARHEQIDLVAFDLHATVDEMRSFLANVLPPTVQLRFELGTGSALTTGDPRELERVLVNLVMNARDAMPGGGEIVIATRRELSDLLICVTDNGAGIPSAVLPYIFEPFFTTKPRGAGTGLGLSTAWGIINAMGGDIRAVSSPSGSRFELRIPEMQRACDAARVGVPPSKPWCSGVRDEAVQPTILLVDDQAPVLRATKRLLEREGFRVLDASSGAAALELLTVHGEPVDILVTDVVMPAMSGVVLAGALRERQPGLRVVYVSGHFEDPGVRRDVEGGGARLLPKPFTPEGIRAVLADALDGPPVVTTSQPVPRTLIHRVPRRRAASDP